MTAGSSGGTAAAVAASLGLVGFGSDTGQLDPRPVVAPGAGRHSLHDGTDQPGGRSAAQPARGHRRTDGANRGRRRQGIPGDRGRRPERPGDQPPRAPSSPGLHRRRSTATDCAARSSASCARPTSARRPTRKSSASSWRPSRTCAAPERPSSIPATVEGLDVDPPSAGCRPVHGLQVRHQSLPGRAGRPRAGEESRRDHQVRALPSLGPTAAGDGRQGARERSRVARLPGRHARIATRSARRC